MCLQDRMKGEGCGEERSCTAQALIEVHLLLGNLGKKRFSYQETPWPLKKFQEVVAAHFEMEEDLIEKGTILTCI